MDQLPSSIEAYLEEAGFSGTEILILRRLMDGEPLTIRQLGAKTGKSTGVLDAAMKKLIKKNIIKKTLINDAPKYSLDSLDAVVEWMQDDMEQKRDLLLRRHQNFESFVTSLESGSKRPDIEYFEGESGIKQAYIKLLNGPGEIFHYLPVTGKEEEDPLRDFRVQYFRERQHRKMFSRILAHDNSLGRRFQSRDAFEYRKTVLVPEAEYPFTFEKIITGDRIACFDHKAQTACVIRYPELADIEKTLFEAIWRHVQLAANAPKEEVQRALSETSTEKIAMSTETMSQVREFFLSRKSLVTFGVFAVMALATTYVLSMHNANIMMDRIKERVKSIAATAALQFDARDVEQIHTIADIQKPEYPKLIHHLNRIRRENEGVTYAYILRPTGEKGTWTFVADADSLDPFEIRDVDGDGEITDIDHLAAPGETYVETSNDDSDLFTLYEAESYNPATDKWGTHITGSAPIFNENNQPIAILGIDVETTYWEDVSRSSFWPLASFVGFFFLFVLIRLAAYNRTLFMEIEEPFALRRVLEAFLHRGLPHTLMHALWRKKIMYIGVIILMTAYWITFAVFYFQRNVVQEETGKRLMAIAATAASQFDPNDLRNLNFSRDMRSGEYQQVFQTLNSIRDANPEIKWIYILRPTNDPKMWEFVADADTNYFLDGADDYNSDGEVSEDEENVWPGRKYYYDRNTFYEALISPSYSKQPETDQWGTFLTGAAPIMLHGRSVAIIGVDIEVR